MRRRGSGRPPRKAPAQEVCHCQVRKTEGRRAWSRRPFQRASSRPSKPGSTSTFIVAPGFGRAGLATGSLVAGPALLHGLVHGGVEVRPKIFAHLVTHALDVLGDAARVVLVEVTVVGGIGGGFHPIIFGLEGGEAGHEAGQLCTAAARTSGRGLLGHGTHEQAHPAVAALTLVLVDGHLWSSSVRVFGRASAPKGCRQMWKTSPTH